jgi:hypothetical protein
VISLELSYVMLSAVVGFIVIWCFKVQTKLNKLSDNSIRLRNVTDFMMKRHCIKNEPVAPKKKRGRPKKNS